jgi:lysophospholipase L1-like esterase
MSHRRFANPILASGRRPGVTRRLLLAVLVAVLTLGSGAADARTAGHGPHLLGTWSASPQPPDLSGVSRAGFDHQTLRLIAYTHFPGSRLRIRLSNTFGAGPLVIGQADLALQRAGAATVPGSDRRLTFAGRHAVTIPAGAEVYSDPVRLTVRAGQNLAVSLFVPAATGPTTWHALAVQTNYVSTPGNHAAETGPDAFTTQVTSWFWLDGIDVVAPPRDHAVVTLGDSITDGFGATVDANTRWPDFLARRLRATPATRRVSVLDEGISGNRVLNDSPCCGVSALARLDRDVLAQDGARWVILLEGINDIGFSGLTDPETAPHTNVSADQIIAGYQRIIARVHARGLKIYGATLTPFKGTAFPGYYTSEGEQKRGAVNHWIRTSGAFDAVIDFDQAIRDPADPLRMLPRYDSGDHLHPNDAGYAAMAAAVDLALFR